MPSMPGADQREAGQACKLGMGFVIRTIFDFAFDLAFVLVSGSPCPLNALEQFAFGALHLQRRFRIGLACGEAV